MAGAVVGVGAIERAGASRDLERRQRQVSVRRLRLGRSDHCAPTIAVPRRRFRASRSARSCSPLQPTSSSSALARTLARGLRGARRPTSATRAPVPVRAPARVDGGTLNFLERFHERSRLRPTSRWGPSPRQPCPLTGTKHRHRPVFRLRHPATECAVLFEETSDTSSSASGCSSRSEGRPASLAMVDECPLPSASRHDRSA